MKIAFITNIRAPYRTLQLEEFSKIENIQLSVFYTNKPTDNRKWEVFDNYGFKEVDLNGVKISEKYGYINSGLLNIVKNNDLIILGGYEQPTMIILSLLCRILKKKYVLLFDGISYNKINFNCNKIKMMLKKLVINNAFAIMGNGKCSQEYFNKIFGYPIEKIYNQYLTIDIKKIDELYEDRSIYKEEIRKKYNISNNDRVVIYSGRLIEIKNIKSIIKALSKLNREDIVLLIIGDGELNNELNILSKQLNVRSIITGFITKQEELFKHYFAGDCLILPSIDEPWGLVVNEAMASGLPVIVSNICGCSKDLVSEGENGYIINPSDINDISDKLNRVLYEDNIKHMSINSKKIIKNWNFEKSKNELEKILNLYKKLLDNYIVAGE